MPRTAPVDGRRLVSTLAVGVVAAVVSLGRLWLGNHDALTQVIWAEDGVFPICVEKAGFLTCLTDPFAGYLLVLPRLVAGLIALLPVESWALATNLMAALLAGVTSALAFLVMRRFGLGVVASVVIGLLPVVAPIVGLEAINALGSSYMLLLYLATLVLAFPSPTDSTRWLPIALVAALLLLTALTIPSAVVLIAVIAVQAVRRSIALRGTAVWVGAIAVGLLAQWLTALSAAKPRAITVGRESFDAWLNAVPDTILTYWPGMQLSEYTLFDVFTVSPLGITGALVVLAITGGGVVLVVRGGGEPVGIGLLLLSGIAYGAGPSLIGPTNNRYFVVPLLLWGAAVMVALDPVIRRSRPWVVASVVVVVLVLWWPAMAASVLRSTPAPRWQDEVARVEAKCVADPGFTERIIVSPYWPPNWGDALAEPTHPDLPCLVVWKWQ